MSDTQPPPPPPKDPEPTPAPSSAPAIAVPPPPPTTESTSPETPTYKVFRPPTQATPQAASLPESYFTPTPSDLKAAQAALHARAEALTNAPLQTRVMREKQEQTRHARWPNTTICVKFPDRTQLEQSFPSTNKIRTIYAFVRNLLREDVKPIKFVLYQSPPRRDLKVSDPQVRDLTLVQLQLAPASVLLLRFEDDSLNDASITAPLAPSVLSRAEDLPAPPDFDKNPPPASSGTSAKTRGHVLGTGAETKVPKWLKIGKK
ncbi:hypothetical protein OF83DRAFT_183079 [Amylostereum chailletii]|nr:hypothetical protein OF83DRAFT_183079 [Amylostereum chailletii]